MPSIDPTIMAMRLPGSIAVCSLLLALACNPRSNTAEQEADSLISQEAGSAVSLHTPVWDDSLKKYFTPGQVVRIKAAKEEFNRIKTASALAKFYQVTLDTVINIVDQRILVNDPTEYSGDDSPDVHWSWFDDYFPVVTCVVLCSECDYGASTNLIPLVEKAKLTPEKEDDLFFDLAWTAFNPENENTDVVYDGYRGGGGNLGGWYTIINCDVCGASMLGSGYHYKLLQQLEKSAPARSLFGSMLDKYMESTLSIYDTRYYHDKTTVLAELDRILASPVLNEAQKKELQEGRDKIEAGEDMQFDCAKGECSWDA